MNKRLILASASQARGHMLRSAGLSFETRPAELDEGALRDLGAQGLADAKALHVAQQNPEALVIGSDQILKLEDEVLTKAVDKDDARSKLLRLKGRSHQLVSALSVARGDEILFRAQDTASLTMHDFDEDFLEHYMARAGEALTASVGAYWLEDAGAWLFEKIEGDYFTILGMPLLPLLNYLRKEGIGP